METGLISKVRWKKKCLRNLPLEKRLHKTQVFDPQTADLLPGFVTWPATTFVNYVDIFNTTQQFTEEGKSTI
jgi:hypothetical protein